MGRRQRKTRPGRQGVLGLRSTGTLDYSALPRGTESTHIPKPTHTIHSRPAHASHMLGMVWRTHRNVTARGCLRLDHRNIQLGQMIMRLIFGIR